VAGAGRALVTGGAGFIGSHLVDALLERGWQVLVVDDLSRGRAENLAPAARLEQLDVCSPRLGELLAGFRPQYVFHLAAQIDVRRSVADPGLDLRVNVGGTINLLRASAGARVRKVIFSSTGGALYGEPERLPADEDHPVHPLAPYGINKYSCEQYLRFWAGIGGPQFAALRYGNVYGPRQDPHGEAGVVAIFCRVMLAGKAPTIFGTGEQLRDYVYVSDVVAANLLAMASPTPEPLNIGTGVGSSVLALVRLLARLTGFGGEPQFAPARPGEVEAIYLDASRARRWGWEPQVSLPCGLARTVDYFRAAGEGAGVL